MKVHRACLDAIRRFLHLSRPEEVAKILAIPASGGQASCVKFIDHASINDLFTSGRKHVLSRLAPDGRHADPHLRAHRLEHAGRFEDAGGSDYRASGLPAAG